MASRDLRIENRDPLSLKAYERNARKHSKKQIEQIVDSISRFGFNVPVLIDGESKIIAGHGRVEAAKRLKLGVVPTILLDHLTEVERRAFLIADNQIALNATWDKDLLGIELADLGDLNFDLGSLGFSLAEVDQLIDYAKAADPISNDLAPEDHVPSLPAKPVTRPGDLFQLDRHVLLCGDARDPQSYVAVMFDEPADLIFTDPPYNCPVNGHVCGLGKIKHREFAMAAGEMTDGEFTAFLTQSMSEAARVCKDGAIAYCTMDWRGMGPMLTAGLAAFTELKQLVVWNKKNGGMGTFYRSKHELVFVFKNGTAPHTNTFGLGDTGRYRTNVWDYAGMNSVSAARDEELGRHPTPKPVALIADAIRDCSLRGEIVLDPFAGSGSTLMAAHITGRQARVIELDELYCDVIIERFQKFTGKEAILMTSGQTFEELAAVRNSDPGEAA